MKEDAIIRVLKLRLKKLKKHFLKLRESFDPEELHDYRLEMKKLKAFLQLLNTYRSQQEKVKLNKGFKNYYKLAGDLRNLQLHEQRVQKLASEHNIKPPVVYLSLLQEEKEKVMEQLHIEKQAISFKKFQKEMHYTKPLELKANVRKSYLVNQYNALMTLLVATSTNDEALHEVRKIVKDIGYNRDYLDSYISLLLPAVLVKKEYTDDLAEKLGVFHDLCVSQYLFQLPAVMKLKEQGESVVLLEMQRIIECEKKQTKQDVLQQLSKL